jgi:hypothetical protein
MGKHEWGLEAWAGEDQRNLEFFERSVAGLGASIAGRRTYDDSIVTDGIESALAQARAGADGKDVAIGDGRIRR